MTNRLEIPAELQSLIEKRENDERRTAERRAEDAASNGGAETSAEMVDDSVSPDSHPDRRSGLDRRSAQRRKQ